MAGDGSISLDNVGLAFGLVVAAGLSTALGAAAVFEKRVVKLASKPVLAAGLGFSGGVMIYVSFVEIFVKSQGAFLAAGRKEKDAYFCATVCLFSGMLLLRLISFLVHKLDKDHSCACDGDIIDNAQEISVNIPPLTQNAGSNGAAQEENPAAGAAAAAAAAEEGGQAPAQGQAAKDAGPAAAEKGGQAGQASSAKHQNKALQQMGLNTAIAIAIHNFPEGLATFVATLADPAVGATLAIAIGVHNIPEGLCVALPIYYATDSRMKGFLWALLSGISEPIGALIGYAIIKSTGEDMNQVVYGILFGVVAGMMIMIVILELLPTAYKYDPTDKFVTTSVGAGMVVMASSLCLFQL